MESIYTNENHGSNVEKRFEDQCFKYTSDRNVPSSIDSTFVDIMSYCNRSGIDEHFLPLIMDYLGTVQRRQDRRLKVIRKTTTLCNTNAQDTYVRLSAFRYDMTTGTPSNITIENLASMIGTAYSDYTIVGAIPKFYIKDGSNLNNNFVNYDVTSGLSSSFGAELRDCFEIPNKSKNAINMEHGERHSYMLKGNYNGIHYKSSNPTVRNPCVFFGTTFTFSESSEDSNSFLIHNDNESTAANITFTVIYDDGSTGNADYTLSGGNSKLYTLKNVIKIVSDQDLVITKERPNNDNAYDLYLRIRSSGVVMYCDFDILLDCTILSHEKDDVVPDELSISRYSKGPVFIKPHERVGKAFLLPVFKNIVATVGPMVAKRIKKTWDEFTYDNKNGFFDNAKRFGKKLIGVASLDPEYYVSKNDKDYIGVSEIPSRIGYAQTDNIFGSEELEKLDASSGPKERVGKASTKGVFAAMVDKLKNKDKNTYKEFISIYEGAYNFPSLTKIGLHPAMSNIKKYNTQQYPTIIRHKFSVGAQFFPFVLDGESYPAALVKTLERDNNVTYEQIVNKKLFVDRRLRMSEYAVKMFDRVFDGGLLYAKYSDDKATYVKLDIPESTSVTAIEDESYMISLLLLLLDAPDMLVCTGGFSVTEDQMIVPLPIDESSLKLKAATFSSLIAFAPTNKAMENFHQLKMLQYEVGSSFCSSDFATLWETIFRLKNDVYNKALLRDKMFQKPSGNALKTLNSQIEQFTLETGSKSYNEFLGNNLETIPFSIPYPKKTFFSMGGRRFGRHQEPVALNDKITVETANDIGWQTYGYVASGNLYKEQHRYPQIYINPVLDKISSMSGSLVLHSLPIANLFTFLSNKIVPFTFPNLRRDVEKGILFPDIKPVRKLINEINEIEGGNKTNLFLASILRWRQENNVSILKSDRNFFAGQYVGEPKFTLNGVDIPIFDMEFDSDNLEKKQGPDIGRKNPESWSLSQQPVTIKSQPVDGVYIRPRKPGNPKVERKDPLPKKKDLEVKEGEDVRKDYDKDIEDDDIDYGNPEIAGAIDAMFT